MKTITKYESTDNKLFETKKECIDHEKSLKKTVNITDRVKSFEDALKIHGETIKSFNKRTQYDSRDEIAFKKLKVIIAVLNEGWVPDWNNSNEYKYYPYFDMSAFGFSYAAYADWLADTHAGSRLCLKTEELARYTGEIFIEIYKDLMVIKK